MQLFQLFELLSQNAGFFLTLHHTGRFSFSLCKLDGNFFPVYHCPVGLHSHFGIFGSFELDIGESSGCSGFEVTRNMDIPHFPKLSELVFQLVRSSVLGDWSDEERPLWTAPGQLVLQFHRSQLIC